MTTGPVKVIRTNELVKMFFYGAKFRTSCIVLTRIISIFRVMVFARIFMPDQLGIAALASSCVVMVTVLGEIGLHQSIIRDKRESPHTSDTAFSLSVIISVGFFLLVILIAPLLSTIFRANISSYVCFLAFTILARPLNLPKAFWDRSLKFGLVSVIPLIGDAGGFIIAVAVQLIFHLGIWSLLIGEATGVFLSTFYVWTFAEFRPRLRLDYTQVKTLLSFGFPFMIQQVNGMVMQRGDNLIVGATCGTIQLAYYNLAWQLPMMVSALAGSLDSMLFPIYARIDGEQEKVIRLFNLSNKMWSLFGAAFTIPLIIYAESVVHILYGATWLPAIPIIKVMILSFTIRFCTGYAYDNIVLVRGRTKYMMKWGFVNTGLIVTVAWGMIYWMGSIGGAWFWVLQAVILIPLVRLPLIKQEVGTLDFLHHIWQPILSGVLTGLICWMLLPYMPLVHILRLGVGLMLYFALYSSILLLIDHMLVSDLKKMIAFARS